MRHEWWLFLKSTKLSVSSQPNWGFMKELFVSTANVFHFRSVSKSWGINMHIGAWKKFVYSLCVRVVGVVMAHDTFAQQKLLNLLWFTEKFGCICDSFKTSVPDKIGTLHRDIKVKSRGRMNSYKCVWF